MSGYVAYIEYQYGIDKGDTAQGDLISNPWGFGKVDTDYTAARVVETIAEGQTELAWGPVVEGSVEKFVDGAWVAVEGEYTPVEGDKVRYAYNNVIVPQDKIPTVKATMKSIALVAKARRIAVYYSQIAAYQAKTDYGVDLGDQLAEKAVGELSYEIDTEIVKLLVDNATLEADLAFSKTVPVGVSRAEHYEAFASVIEEGKQMIYRKTQKFMPNYMIVASDVLPVISLIKSWRAAPLNNVNGPFYAGDLNGVKVFVSPAVAEGTFVLGVNGSDMMSSAAVYAPYMSVVPTQLLGFADGGMSQGFSTLYDLKMLNANLLVKGTVTK